MMSMVAGIGYAWTSPCIPKLNGNINPENNPLIRPTTILEDSWITSLQSLGALFGSLLSGAIANKYGRKKTLILFSLPMMASNIILIFADAVSHFYAARFLVGIGTGCVFSVIPLYVAEISEVTNRGFTSMFLSLMITSVQVFVYIIGPYISISTLAMISLGPSILFLLIFGFFIPESPYYLTMVDKQIEAEMSLGKLRHKSKGYIQKELLDILKSIDQSRSEKSSLKDIIKSKVVIKCLVIALGLMFFQQFSGILAILPYLQTIFDATKSSIPGDISVMIVGLVQFITIAITSQMIDKVDRKKLLFLSNIGVLLSLISLGAYFYLQGRNIDVDALFWLPIGSILLYIICFNSGIGPLTWTITGEIFPPDLKTYLNGLATSVNILFGFLISMFFPTFSLVLSMAWTLWVFAACTAASLIFIKYCLPETKANLMSMVGAIGYAWTSPCIPKLNGSVDPQNNPLGRPTTLIEDSWITSLQSLGALCGPLFSGPAADKIGRKNTLIIFSLPMLASNIILIFANDIIYFYIARFLVGIGAGCVFSVTPLYIAEISEVTNRGFTSMFLGLMVTGVQLLVFAVGPYITISTLAMVSLSPSILFLFFFGFFVPESPYYLVMIDKQVEAENCLAKLRRTGYVQKELLDITKSVEESKVEVTISDLIKSKVVMKGLLVSLGLMFFQQFCGIIALMSYLQTIFDATESSIPGDVCVMIVGLVQFITTAITSRIVDKVDRKQLLFWSNLGIFLSLVSLGTYFYLQINNFDVEPLYWLPVSSAILYIIGFNSGIGPLVWTIAGEIFPPNMKTYLNGISTFIYILLGFLISMFFPTVSQVLGMAWSMWIFAIFTAVSLIFIRYYLPETRNKSFLEIQVMLREGRIK